MGNFDGLHRGHQQLIGLGREIADLHQEELAVFTFYPQIQAVLDKTFRYLLTEMQKEQLMKKLGVETIVTVPFDAQIAKTSAASFISEILVKKLQARHVVVGFNYTFGYMGAGTPALLQELAPQHQLEVTVMAPYLWQGEVVSSTAIRQALKAGQIEKANQMLGYRYRLSGLVVAGNKIGRTIGFPTANLAFLEDLLLPADGVYAVQVQVNGMTKEGFLNIGVRPTVNQNLQQTIEVNIFDFDGDLYGKELTVEFCSFLRGERRFSGLDALKQQLEQDKQKTRALLREIDG